MSSLVLVAGWEMRTPMTEMPCQSRSPHGAKGEEEGVVGAGVGEVVVRVEVEESQSGGDEESRTLIHDYVLSASSVSLELRMHFAFLLPPPLSRTIDHIIYYCLLYTHSAVHRVTVMDHVLYYEYGHTPCISLLQESCVASSSQEQILVAKYRRARVQLESR